MLVADVSDAPPDHSATARFASSLISRVSGESDHHRHHNQRCQRDLRPADRLRRHTAGNDYV